MKFAAGLLLLCATFSAAFSQDDEDEYDENYEFPETVSMKASLGLGLGLDYGVIGAKLTIVPTEKIGLFAGIGYNFVGLAWNVGAEFKFLPDKRVCPYASAMYGTNASIVVIGKGEYDKAYYGPSFGGGIQLRTRRENYFNFGMWIPIRSSEYRNDWDVVRNDPAVEISSDPLPIALSVGYHLSL